jgi:LmbE family N-acetylglucosaminyl deacetylase
MSAMSDRLSPADLGTILGVWAHPDDESYLMAGTALLAASAGSHVACLTATLGEAGETSDEDRWPRAELASIRRREMAACLDLLGVRDHTWLDLPDGGLHEVDRERGVDSVSEVVERVRPDTILTFGPDGMTGHPDHIAIGRWATEAASRVMGSSCQVLLATKSPAWAHRFAQVNQMFQIDPPRTTPDRLALHVALPDDLLDRKVRSLQAQASQTSALAASMGDHTYRAWVAEEFWVRAG